MREREVMERGDGERGKTWREMEEMERESRWREGVDGEREVMERG